MSDHVGGCCGQVVLKVGQSLNCEALYLVDDLALLVIDRLIDAEEADARLEDILAMPPRYSKWVQWLSFTFASFACAIIFFNGGWADAVCAGMFGTCVGLFRTLTEKYPALNKLMSVIVTTGISFATTLLLNYYLIPNGYNACYFDIMLSSVVWLLCGVSLTTGVIELANGSMISGAARIFGAIFQTLMIGFGMAIGGSIAFWVPAQYDTVCVSWLSENGQAYGIIFFLMYVA